MAAEDREPAPYATQEQFEQLASQMTGMRDMLKEFLAKKPPTKPDGGPEPSLEGESHSKHANDDEQENAEQGEDYKEELRRMKKRLAEVEKGKKRKTSQPDMLQEPPFTKEVTEASLPRDFRLPRLKEYDGTGDPWHHVTTYRQIMQLHGFDDSVLCKAFPTTLRKAAQDWYGSIKPNTVASFQQLANPFTQQFIAARKCKRSSVHLMNIKQGEDETLRKYILRFNEAMLDMKEVSVDTATAALIGGTTNIDLKKSLVTEPPETLDEVMDRADLFMNAEETLNPLGDRKDERKPGGDRDRRRTEDARRRDDRAKRRPTPPRPFERFTPLNTPALKF